MIYVDRKIYYIKQVSHDQFDAACDDLTRGLEEAVDKLNMQESIWQQVLDEVQNEIASKVDKIEMTPLKDFVNNRLKSLQEKLKSIAEMRRECEAAGTKKLLRWAFRNRRLNFKSVAFTISISFFFIQRRSMYIVRQRGRDEDGGNRWVTCRSVTLHQQYEAIPHVRVGSS